MKRYFQSLFLRYESFLTHHRQKYTEKTSRNFRFIFPIGCLFVTDLLISNITAFKVMIFCGLVLPGGSLSFPLTFIIDDILTEVYGFKWSRYLMWVAFLCSVFAIVYFNWVIDVPAASFWPFQKEFALVLGATPRIVFASLLSYICGEFVNALVLSKVKLWWEGRFFPIRAVGSTMIGVAIDSLVFLPIAFYGLPLGRLFEMGGSLFLFKVGYECLMLPLTCFVVYTLKRLEGVDVYDYHTRFTPFSFDHRYSPQEMEGQLFKKMDKSI